MKLLVPYVLRLALMTQFIGTTLWLQYYLFLKLYIGVLNLFNFRIAIMALTRSAKDFGLNVVVVVVLALTWVLILKRLILVVVVTGSGVGIDAWEEFLSPLLSGSSSSCSRAHGSRLDWSLSSSSLMLTLDVVDDVDDEDGVTVLESGDECDETSMAGSRINVYYKNND